MGRGGQGGYGEGERGMGMIFVHFLLMPSDPGDRLVALVVKASTTRAEDPGFGSRLRRDFFRGRVIPVTLKTGTPVAILPGVWRYKVSAGTGWPGVSIL